MLNAHLIPSSDYVVNNSGRWIQSQSDRMIRSFTASNRKTWTFSTWLKRSSIGSYQTIWTSYVSVNGFMLRFNPTNTLEVFDANFTNGRLITTATYTNTSNWMHIVVRWDTTNSTANNRIRIYIDGVQVTSFGTRVNPALNGDGGLLTTRSHYLGMRNSMHYMDAYMAETHFVDGQSLAETDFGFDDGGTWKPKKYLGTYGTEGFYMFYENGGNLGEDDSGNGNNFTNTGVTQSTDVPP